MFGLVEEYYNGKGALSYTHEICPEEKFCMEEELRKEVLSLEQQTLYGYTWNKIYSLDYMRKLNLKFETVTLIEDIVFNVQYFMDIERLNIWDRSVPLCQTVGGKSERRSCAGLFCIAQTSD